MAAAERGEGHDGRDRPVRVLTAVLPDARRIALDVARVPGAAHERWREEQNDRLLAVDQVLLDRVHRAGGAARVGGLRENGPRLGDRDDATLPVLAGAQRRAVVEVRA